MIDRAEVRPLMLRDLLVGHRAQAYRRQLLRPSSAIEWLLFGGFRDWTAHGMPPPAVRIRRRAAYTPRESTLENDTQWYLEGKGQQPLAQTYLHQSATEACRIDSEAGLSVPPSMDRRAVFG